jgi:DNA-binding MurR/RpiR family transcriptional regulator
MTAHAVSRALQGTGLPSDHPLAQKVKRVFDSLSPGQQRVARLLLESPYTVAFLSVADVGRHAEVSDSTVVRFAADLGYPGYPELRGELQTSLVARMAPLDLLKRRMKADGRSPVSALHSEIENVASLEATLTPELIARAVDVIVGANNIFVLGMRSGFGVAHTCWHLLQQILGNVQLLSLAGGSLPDQLVDVERGDVVIAFSTSRYSRQLVQIGAHARAKGAAVVAVTDRLLSPIGRVASVTIPVPTGSLSFFPSMVAAHAAVNVVISEIARREQKRATRRLSRLEDVADSFDLFLEAETSHGSKAGGARKGR